jgi:hypothetical protein
MSVWKLCLCTEFPVIFIEFEGIISADADIVNKTFECWIWAGFGIFDNIGSPDLNRGA